MSKLEDREVGRHLAGCGDGRPGLTEVAHRLDEDEVRPTGGQPSNLLGEQGGGLLERQRAEGVEQLAGGPDVAGDQRAVPVSDPACDGGSGAVDLLGPTGQAVCGQPGLGRAERVGREDAGACGRVVSVEVRHGIRVREVPGLGAVTDGQAAVLQEPAVASVEQGRAVGEQGQQSVRHRTTVRAGG